MRIFIAGGSGVLGRALVRLLNSAGHEVTASTRSTGRTVLLRQLGATPVVLDAFDRDAVVDVVDSSRPDVIVHLLTDLAMGDVAGNARLRASGTRNLVDAAAIAGTPAWSRRASPGSTSKDPRQPPKLIRSTQTQPNRDTLPSRRWRRSSQPPPGRVRQREGVSTGNQAAQPDCGSSRGLVDVH